MKALILVGGYGTRLRPLTLSVPKPLVHFCNQSIVQHQIAALAKIGVAHVILAVAYKPQDMLDALSEMEKKFNLKISCSLEDEPLGTGGPIRQARNYLLEGASESDCFFMFNSDVICKFPLEELLKQHKETNAEGTVLVTEVKDPSKFGVVVHDNTGKISKFVEKPEEFVGNWINAGIYILQNKVIERIELRYTSIEKEVFPEIVADGGLYCMKLKGFWADIGKPMDFIDGMRMYLESLKDEEGEPEAGRPSVLAKGPAFMGNVLIDPSAIIGKGCCIGPNVSIDKNCIIGDGCRIKNASIMAGVKIGDFSLISHSIVGWQSRIGKWAHIERMTVIGEDVAVKDECYVNEALILPHKTINESIRTSGSIIM